MVYWQKTVCLLTLLLAPTLGAEPLRVAFMHENPVGQGGWTLSHEIARKRLQAHFGEQIETRMLDGVAPGGDSERVLTKLAREGNDMIFATSFGFMNTATRVARRFPRTTFEHAAGYSTGRNLGTYQIRAYQGRYLAGFAAGQVSEAGRIGYVGAFPIPEVIRGINAFTLGVQAANPDAVVEVIWITTWSDAGRAREATQLLLSRGADVITHHTETASAIQTAEQSGAWSVGYQTDRSAFAPQHHLVSVAHNWFPIYRDKVQAKLDGRWQSSQDWVGVEADATQLVAWGNAVLAPVIEAVAALREQLAQGGKRVFVGPLQDASGAERVPAGVAMSDEEMMSMEWLVKGVLGGKPN